jgi:hypothetical protein
MGWSEIGIGRLINMSGILTVNLPPGWIALIQPDRSPVWLRGMVVEEVVEG